jgi:hypothetical protein
MKLTHPLYRRILFIFAAVVFAVALVLSVGVIPAVKAEASAGGTPQIAVRAIWANMGLNLLSAAVMFLLAARWKGRSRTKTVLQSIAGLIVLLLGLALGDAASAYRSHGPNMQTASILLFVCAAAGSLTGLAVVVTAFLAPEKEQAG